MATFETAPRSPEDVRAWFDGVHPVVVVEEAGEVIAFGCSRPYSSRECYRGIAGIPVYAAHAARRRGADRLALTALITEAEKAGFWKLLSRIFVENTASRTLVAALGFREVGIYRKHAQLDGVWRDCLIVERLIPANLE